MKVKELIAELSKLDGDLTVMVYDFNGRIELEAVNILPSMWHGNIIVGTKEVVLE